MSKTNNITRSTLLEQQEEISGQVKKILDRLKNLEKRRWLRTKEAAKYLSISNSQLHALKTKGIISCTKLAGTNYYDRKEIDHILESQLDGEKAPQAGNS
ncbi:Helix-turn-helix domain-containing protein [Fodinibius roseus]|uniref:Helix-turn-helix domain-containing protein n=1 Tax=Fodinibius roseus TaxID=1194090 RepID=A0A1M5I9S1_9BACT|nr:helix-turn-helix domain-containing protein [Fodinibius roseus]SHG24620.1 Helix-turn-helix domain-containing protein [Fodinibius roseus]